MAFTQITNLIEPAVYLKYTKEYMPEKLDIMTSGIFGNPIPELAAQMAAGGSTIDIPYWQDVTRSEPAGQTDDTTTITPQNVTATKMTARKLFWAQAWSQAALAGAYATGNTRDPLKSVVDFTEAYWRRIMQLTVIKCLDGVRADNVANDAGDMRYTVYSDIATPLAANKISPAAVNRARYTMGEMMNGVGTIIMHSKVYTDALDQEAITFVQPHALPFKIEMFAGCQVIVSDDVTVTSGTNSPMYRSYLIGPGALQQETHFPERAVATFFDEGKGNGAGIETLYNRRHVLIHPQGFRFTSSSVAGKSPTWAELATAANWDRKFLRKNCNIVYLETN